MCKGRERMRREGERPSRPVLGPQRRRLLQQSWAGVFRDYLLQHLPVKELAASFRDDFGRPSKDLHVALGALILQQLHDLTDQQTTEAVALNIAWHYALDIRREPDASLCERTLRNYRCKILELGLDEVLFRTLSDKLIAAVGVDASKQRLDSTAVRSAIRGLTRLGILVEAARKFLRELKTSSLQCRLASDSSLQASDGHGPLARSRHGESDLRGDVARLRAQHLPRGGISSGNSESLSNTHPTLNQRD